MTPSLPSVELEELVHAQCEGVLTDAQAVRLEALVADNTELRHDYILYLHVHACAERLAKKYRTLGQMPLGADSGENDEAEPFCATSSLSGEPVVFPPTLHPVATSEKGSYSFPAWSLSYLVATLLFALGVLVGSFVHISRPGHTPELVGPSTPGLRGAAADMVGYITGTVDCQWQKTRSGAPVPGTEISNLQIPKSPNPQIPVFLGDRFHVAFGLMQITYDTGAQVLLQGPCAYEIDSDRSGYLAVGKLTAKVEKGSGVRGPGSGNAYHSPLSFLPSPLFAVRTPTAVVTDLGTEFGVEVEQSGATRSHVFQGTIELRASNSRRSTTPGELAEILHAGESARVERGWNNKVAIIRGPGQPGRFVRRISKSPNPQISKSSPSSLIPHPSSFAYRLTDLGTLGGAGSQAFSINSVGHVVGEAATADGTMNAFMYADGQMKNLDTLHGSESRAWDVNVLGQVVGEAINAVGVQRAFFYHDGKMEDIGTLGGTVACARGINDAGAIVGASQQSSGVLRAFLYTAGAGMKDLGSLGGVDAESGAMDINNRGMVMGYSGTHFGHVHPFIYRSGAGMKDLGSLGGNDRRALGFGMNAVGQVVGCSIDDENRRAFLYSDETGIIDIGSFGGKVNQALDINNAGDIVGYARVDRANHAFLYHDGQMIDLHTLVAPATGWILRSAAAINDSGWIAGYGKAPDGGVRAFLLTPVKRPKDRNEE